MWPSVGSSLRLPVVSSIRVIAQAISRRSLTVKVRVRSHPSLYGFGGEKVAVGPFCLRVVRLFPVSLIPSLPQLYRFTYCRSYIIVKIHGVIKCNSYRKILIFPSYVSVSLSAPCPPPQIPPGFFNVLNSEPKIFSHTNKRQNYSFACFYLYCFRKEKNSRTKW